MAVVDVVLCPVTRVGQQLVAQGGAVLFDAIQHPAQAIGEALTGKGSLPQDALAAGVGYGAYKGSKAAYQYMRPQGAVAAPTEAVEASTAAAEESESVLDVVEGAVESVPEVMGEIVPEGALEFAPLLFA